MKNNTQSIEIIGLDAIIRSTIIMYKTYIKVQYYCTYLNNLNRLFFYLYCNFYTPSQCGNPSTWYMESVTGHYYFQHNYDINQDGIVIAVFVNSELDRVEDN